MKRAVWRLGAVGCAVGVAVLATSDPAAAYVRSRTELGNAFYWKTSCVPATIYTNGFEDAPGGFTVDKVAKSVAAAAHAWSPDEVTCPGAAGGHPYLEIVPTLSQSDTPPAIAWDSKNSIVIRTDLWAKSGNPKAEPYLFDALAVTTVTARGDGHIVDADIEVNAISKAWLDLDPGVTVSPGQGTFEVHDLQNTLTHEFGHFLGLDHTCFNPQSSKPRPQDEDGQPIFDCDSAPPAVAMTTMFDRAESLETSKRFLADDDKRAVCEIYDSASDPRTCEVDQPNDGCAIAAASPAGRGGTGEARVLGALVAGALAFAVARRRGRSS